MIPIIHMDYACLTEKGLFRLDELSEEDREHAVRVIVGYCSSSAANLSLLVALLGTTCINGLLELLQ